MVQHIHDDDIRYQPFVDIAARQSRIEQIDHRCVWMSANSGNCNDNVLPETVSHYQSYSESILSQRNTRVIVVLAQCNRTHTMTDWVKPFYSI